MVFCTPCVHLDGKQFSNINPFRAHLIVKRPMAPNPASGITRKTIGVFAAQAGRTWGLDFISGLEEAASRADANLIYFIGGKPAAVHLPEQKTISYGLYELAKTAHLSGILLSADLGHGLSSEDLRSFSRRFGEIPLTACALDVDTFPSLISDNLNGMRMMIRHLIQTHGYRRIAFIRGPEGQLEAQQRLRAYRDELKANGLLYDESLVVPGDFSQESGHRAVETLIKERQLRLDAIAAANDRMAFGAIEALHLLGYNVPGDMAVTGFDDIREARALGVPLTTVSQSFFDLGKNSLETLIKLIAGEQVPAQAVLPTRLVIRWSCGCQPEFIKQAVISKEEVARTGRLENKQDAVLRALLDASGAPDERQDSLRSAYNRVWNTFLEVMRGEKESVEFLQSVEFAIRVLQVFTEDATRWNSVLSIFRHHALASILDRDAALHAENLFQQARMMIGELSQRLQAYKRLQLEQQEHLLQDFGFAMAPAMRLDEIAEAISRSFPALGIERMLVVLDGQSPSLPPPPQRRVVMQYENGHCSLLSGPSSPVTGHLIPGENIPTGRRFTAIVMPLSLAQNRFGYMWIEMKPGDWEVFPRVRNLLSSALLRALLVDQRETAQREVERLLQEAKQRAEELSRLYQNEQGRRREANSLSKAVRHLSNLLDVDQVPRQILEQLALVLPHGRGSLIMESADGTVRILAQHGFPDDARAQDLRIPINAGGVYDQIASKGEAIIIPDVTLEDGWKQVDWLPLHYSWMGVPLFPRTV